jgi:LuxR family maltose regulon positive regulatory protein
VPDPSDGRDPLAEVRHLLDTVPDGHRVALVLDDAHDMRSEPLLAGLVDLTQRRRQFHLVVCARGHHPVETLAGGAVDVEVILPSDLLLTVDEISELAHVMGVVVSREQAKRVHDAVGGWVGAIRTVFAAIAAGADGLPVARASEYVREVVIPGIRDQRTLTELMRFSLATRLTHALIRDLSDEPDPDQSVAMVESPGLAQRHYREADVELVLPSVVRDALSDAYLSRDAVAARAMHARLAAWYATREGHDFVLMAFQHAAAGHDWTRLDQIWDGHAVAIGMRNPAAVAAVLRALPEPVIAARPGMLVGRAAISVAAADSDADGRMATLRAYFEASSPLVATRLDSLRLPDLLYIGTWHMVGLRMRGRFEAAVRFRGELERRVLARTADGVPPGGRLGWFHLQTGLTWTLLGQHDSAIRSYELCWQSRAGTATYIPSNAAANLALTYALRADQGGADLWLARHAEFDTAGEWGHYLVGIGAHVAAGLLALDRLDAASCRTELAHLGNGAAPVELWPFIAYLHAEYGLHFGDPAVSLADLHAARRAHQRELANQGAAAELLTRAAADLLIASGQPQRANHLLARSGPTRSAVLAVARARIALLSGNNAATRDIAADALWMPETAARERVELLVLEALAAHRMNDLEHSRKQATRAVGLASNGLLASLRTVQPEELTILLRLADRQLDPGQLALVTAQSAPYPIRVQLVSLTPREQQLAAALTTTASRQSIADELHISINTLKKQLVSLYRKLGATSRDGACVRLRELGLIQ